MFGQEGDSLERQAEEIKADIKHQLFLIEQDIQWQSLVMRSQIQLQIDEIHNRIFIDYLLSDIYDMPCRYDIYREPVARPYLYLLNPLANGFPIIINDMDIYEWRRR
jgi:hypothetical protein